MCQSELDLLAILKEAEHKKVSVIDPNKQIKVKRFQARPRDNGSRCEGFESMAKQVILPPNDGKGKGFLQQSIDLIGGL